MDPLLGKIPYTKPSITELELQYASDAAQNGWGEQCYDYIVRFEDAFKVYLGVNYAIATSSCTGALHMGMHALGIGPGDEVIMADNNWVATAAPIVHLGAIPVFVDILADSWCLDPEQVEAAITPKTKAIIAVHLYGNLCEMEALLAIGKRHGISIIEDAAEAIGSSYHGNMAGSMGDFGAFSFHGTKTITTGEGGMFVTNDPHLYEQVLTLSNHGRARGQAKQFWPELVGFKYKMSNIQAALGCAQIERVDELVKNKRDIFECYRSLLSHLPLTMNPEPKGCINGFWMPTVVLNQNLTAKSIMDFLRTLNIDARPFFWPLSTVSIPLSRKTSHASLSRKIHDRAFNLPAPFGLEEAQILFIVNALIRSIGNS